MRIGLLMLGDASVQAMVERARLAEGGRLRSPTGEFVFGFATPGASTTSGLPDLRGFR
jgi:hypothetical protein